MRMPSSAQPPRIRILAVTLIAAGTVFANAAGARDPVNFEGTWKIAAPQSAFIPIGGSIPFTKDGAERFRKNQELRAKGRYVDFDYASARCASPGTARLALTPEPFRIWQRDGLIIFQYQWNNILRQIDAGAVLSSFRFSGGPIDATNDDLAGAATPIAKGHWEGRELVAVSSGFVDYILVDAVVPHGPDLRITERIRLKDARTLEDRLTIADPETFEKPWETSVTYRRQPDAPFREDVCLERVQKGPAPL